MYQIRSGKQTHNVKSLISKAESELEDLADDATEALKLCDELKIAPGEVCPLSYIIGLSEGESTEVFNFVNGDETETMDMNDDSINHNFNQPQLRSTSTQYGCDIKATQPCVGVKFINLTKIH